jgi:hypothetical protein
VQQVADDREDNSHADPDRDGEKPFIDLISQPHQSFNVHSLKPRWILCEKVTHFTAAHWRR